MNAIVEDAPYKHSLSSMGGIVANPSTSSVLQLTGSECSADGEASRSEGGCESSRDVKFGWRVFRRHPLFGLRECSPEK